MTFAQVLSFYLTLNLLLAVGYFLIAGLTSVFQALRWSWSAREQLKIHYAIFSVVFVFSFVPFLFSQGSSFAPPVRIWSASSMQSFAHDYTPSAKEGFLKLPAQSEGLRVDQLKWMLGVGAGVILLIALIFIIRDVMALFKFRQSSILFRKIGRVHISFNQEVYVPFSFWLPGEAHIVLPLQMLTRGRQYQMAVAHEIQHHRQGDTRWVFILWAVKWFCFLNPTIYLWIRKISEVQEFACDETLVDLKKVESQAYASCLVEVAETALLQKGRPVGAMGMAFLAERNLLKRRIGKMLFEPTNKISRSVAVGIGVLVVTALGVTASAAKNLVQDRRVTLEQAQTMANSFKGDSGFPVMINDRVLRQLNRYVSTPEGRDFMKMALQRMEAYRTLVDQNLRKYAVPVELMAMPVIESGYKNLPQKPGAANKSAGIWQFIPNTARVFGLKVTAEQDDRMDVARETDAAMRLLKSNQLRFNNWLLSVMAYNMGENAVQAAIDATGSREAWTLIQAGYEGDQNYLAKVMAAILIVRNPQIVD
jgi:membrane-bound lytic murein transglycosylase D